MAENVELELVKYEGLANDFLVLAAPVATADMAGLAREVCHRHRGFGADGLLVRGSPPESGEAFTFALFNADGSSAEMSGNGLRCLAHAAMDAGAVPREVGSQFDVLTPAGPRRVAVRGWRGAELWSATAMGRPTVAEGDGGRCNVGHGQLRVDVGNPHLVVLGPDPATVDVAVLGPALSAEVGAATGGVNVEFVALGPDKDEVTMRVWERGVGETQACGTGSVAAAKALEYWGRVGRRVTVHQPGGAAEVELCPDGTAVLVGPSRRIGRCVWERA